MKKTGLIGTLWIFLTMLLALPGPVQAALKASGPIGTMTTLPTWYQDTTDLALQLCLDQNGFCIMPPNFDPDPAVAPERTPPNAPLSTITTTGPIDEGNFPDESFYFIADAIIDTPSGAKLVYRAALEAAFLAGVSPNSGITFLRINLKKTDNLQPNSLFTVTHPFGTFTFTTDANGDTVVTTSGQAFRTEDPLGPSPGVYFPPEMQGAVTTNVGPFLKRAAGLIVNLDGTYIGDAVTPMTVTGSPTGNNFFRVEGPNVGGAGIDSIETDLFTLAGKVFTGTIASPMTIDRSTYARDDAAGQVDIFVTALPTATLTLTGTGIPTTNLVQNVPNSGKFFAHIPFATMPTGLNIENSLNIPTPSSIANPVILADEVNITQSSYDPVAKTLTIKAASRDKVAPLPTLTAPQFALPNTLDANGILVVPLNTTIPPQNVTVSSSKGGAAVAPVSVVLPQVAPVAVNDAEATPYLTPVVVSVLANDTTTGTLDPTTVAIVAQQNGTAVANSDGTVTFTPAAAFSGAASFSYTVRDALNQLSNIAVATVTVSAPLPTVSSVTLTPSLPSPNPSGSAAVQFNASAQGSSNYLFRFLLDGNEVQPYGGASSWTMAAATPPGNHLVAVEVKTNPFVSTPDKTASLSYQVSAVITKSSTTGGAISGPATALYGSATAYTFTPNAGFYVADILVDGSSVGAVTTYTVPFVAANTTIDARFARQEIVLRNGATGSNLVWFMDGVTRSATGSYQALTDQNWEIAAAADFNNDGKRDLIWRNKLTGANTIWYLSGTSRTGTASIPTVGDLAWKIVSVGDFNNDGQNDILWRNTSTGANLIWYMNGASRTGTASIPALSDQNWEIVASGDFNGNGKRDILWRNKLTGANTVWYLDGTTRTGSAAMPAEPDLTWKVFGAGDFSGDGRPDLLWRNSVSGQNQVWYMNGVSRTGIVALPAEADLNWKLTAN